MVEIMVPNRIGGSSSSWRKLITGINDGATGGRKLLGKWLTAGDVIDIGEGAIIFAFDTMKTYEKDEYRIGIHVVNGEKTYCEYEAQYKSKSGAYGKNTMEELKRVIQEREGNIVSSFVLIKDDVSCTRVSGIKYCENLDCMRKSCGKTRYDMSGIKGYVCFSCLRKGVYDIQFA